ncbi:MAG: hypothetical protein IPQ09_08565 [Myxococcales bacterium]|nr:hypothetical protein [Myxococcales bacterium]
MLLEDIVARHVDMIFPGVRLKGVYAFRVTRNFDIEIDEEEAEDLLQTIQQESPAAASAATPSGWRCPRVHRGVALQAGEGPEARPVRDVYRTTAVLNVSDPLALFAREERRNLRDEPDVPLAVPWLRDAEDIFAAIRDGDILLHHPYESFDPIVELVSRAAEDPDVLASSRPLLRRRRLSIVKALARAAESGKQVTAIVELEGPLRRRVQHPVGPHPRAERACTWSWPHGPQDPREVPAHRPARAGLRRYVHLSTGTYNPGTARHYTDVSAPHVPHQHRGRRVVALQPAHRLQRPARGTRSSSRPRPPRGGAGPHRAGGRAGSPREAGAHRGQDELARRRRRDRGPSTAPPRQAQITLLIRGICCLRPGVPNVSENIRGGAPSSIGT